MEVKGRRERARQLASGLQQSGTSEVQQVKEMIGLLLEDAKHNLVTAEGDALIRLQGEARLLQRIYEQLTVRRVELPTRERTE
jgi:hypothetical protein